LKTSSVVLAGLAGLAAAWLAVPAHAQFSSNPATQFDLAGGVYTESQPKLRIGRGATLGGYWVAYMGSSPAGDPPTANGYNYMVTRMNADGSLPAGWTNAGVVAYDAAQSATYGFGFDADAAGNAYVAGGADGNDRNINYEEGVFLQKVAPDGSLPWGATGILVRAQTTPGIKDPNNTVWPASPYVCCTNDGNIVVAWAQSELHTRADTTTATYSYTWVQKVTPSGTTVWGPVKLVPAAGNVGGIDGDYSGYMPAALTASDNGSVIVNVNTTGPVRAHAQKLDGATGTPLWNGGNPVILQAPWYDSANVLHDNNGIGAASGPFVVSDGQNGAIACWSDAAIGSSSGATFRCRVQHVDKDGNVAFNVVYDASHNIIGSGVPGLPTVSDDSTAYIQSTPAVAYDPVANEIYVAVTQAPNGHTAADRSVTVSKIDASGVNQFGGGIEIQPHIDLLTFPADLKLSFVGDGVIATWDLNNNTGGQMKAAKVTNEGTVEWAPFIFNSENSSKSRGEQVAIPDYSGVVTCYGSQPNGNGDVFASRINSNGTIGNPPTCGSADFNCDGDIGTDADIEAFFACLAGNCPPPPCASTADFNADGDIGTDADIEAFFRVLAGGNC
jgi:hypothetical protein